MLRRIANFILDVLFPCDHQQRSWPITLNGRTYRACIHCGAEIPYSMKDFCDITPAYLRWKKRQAKRRRPEEVHDVHLDIRESSVV
jgi:hypothetical protein